jgi:hypothetical protein
MNFHHTVALAIVGWYLMAPIPGHDPAVAIYIS